MVDNALVSEEDLKDEPISNNPTDTEDKIGVVSELTNDAEERDISLHEW